MSWGDERAIAAAGRTIIYVLHDNIGHLGIFVAGDVARKEHDQLVNSLDVIESLPPGLYEMKLELKAGREDHRWEELEPGDFSVHYEHRTMDDIRALNPEGRAEEALFSTISKVSELNAEIYKAWMRPWVQASSTRLMGDAMTKLHPLRLQRELLSDAQPFAPLLRQQAQQAREHRVQLAPDHPLRQLEQVLAAQITATLDQYRVQRDDFTVAWARLVYGPFGLGALFKPDTPDEDVAKAHALNEIALVRERLMEHINEGGVPEAVCRLVLAGMVSIGRFERRSFRLAPLLAPLLSKLPALGKGAAEKINWVKLLKEQARITAVAPVEALNALEHMLPDRASREGALALAAAVMMIEPTLDNPRSEILEFVINTMQVDPQRVISLAQKLTQEVAAPVAAKKTRSPSRSKAR